MNLCYYLCLFLTMVENISSLEMLLLVLESKKQLVHHV